MSTIARYTLKYKNNSDRNNQLALSAAKTEKKNEIEIHTKMKNIVTSSTVCRLIQFSLLEILSHYITTVL